MQDIENFISVKPDSDMIFEKRSAPVDITHKVAQLFLFCIFEAVNQIES